MAPEGLIVIDDAIDEQRERELLALIESLQLQPVAGPKSRQVVQFGIRYDYKAAQRAAVRRRGVELKAADSTEAEVGPMPEWSLDLAAELNETLNRHLTPLEKRELGSSPMPDRSIIVNRYLPGEGISAHRDALSYGPVIACLVIGSGAEVEFTSMIDSGDIHWEYIHRRCLYLMTGPSRYDYTHMIRPRKNDEVDGDKIARGVRYSITYRNPSAS